VVDSSDLSLNVSRELLQQDAVVESMRTALTKRVLDMLDKLSRDDPAKYAILWKEFGRVLKEGPAEDHANREKVAGLLRFSTTHNDSATPDQSLADYIGRRKGDQKTIWYLTADSFTAAKSSPHLEVFRKRGLEVLLLTDTIDEWLIGHLGDFDGHEFRDVKRGELELEGVDQANAAAKEPETGEHQALLERLKQQLGKRVQDVRTTNRLSESAACLVLGEHEMGAQMRKLMQSTGQTVPEAQPILEVNPAHPLLVRLAGETDETRFADLALLLVDQAHLAEGGQLEDPGAFVQRLNRILLG
jgi:molecular chaperone HtpG